MIKEQCYLTKTALNTLKKIGRDTEKCWGKVQARRYLDSLLKGSYELIDSYKRLPCRTEMTSNTGLFLHQIHHHYVAFKIIRENEIAVIAYLHESMDIPTRLKEFQEMSAIEISTL